MKQMIMLWTDTNANTLFVTWHLSVYIRFQYFVKSFILRFVFFTPINNFSDVELVLVFLIFFLNYFIDRLKYLQIWLDYYIFSVLLSK